MLVGSYEVAQRVGLRHPQYVHYYRTSDPTFPAPVAVLGNPRNPFYVWSIPDIDRWARKKGLVAVRPSDTDSEAKGLRE